MSCIFCDIVSDTVPAHKIWEDEKHLAFLSIYPNTPGTTVVIPKKHYTSYAFDVPDDVLSELVIAAKTVGKMLDLAFDDVGRTGLVFEGFGVDHVHAKLFPLHGTKMDFWKPLHAPQKTFSEKYDGFISSHDGERMNDEKLEKTAENIRKICEEKV